LQSSPDECLMFRDKPVDRNTSSPFGHGLIAVSFMEYPIQALPWPCPPRILPAAVDERLARQATPAINASTAVRGERCFAALTTPFDALAFGACTASRRRANRSPIAPWTAPRRLAWSRTRPRTAWPSSSKAEVHRPPMKRSRL